MTCEKAEELLSAYLDDTLDPQRRREFEAHLSDCASCQTVLDDYRRFDALLAHAPRVAPSDDLRERIFSSPTYASIARTREAAPAPQLRLIPRAASHSTSPGVRVSQPPGWRRIALQSAAVLALLLGSALLVKQGLFAFAPQTKPSTASVQTLGAPPQNARPLAAGARLIYLHDGALWSAPETGPGLAQRLTPAGVSVAAWSVSPAGSSIAYIDQHSGRLLTIRADGLRDTVIAQAVPAALAASSSFWATPAAQAVRAGVAWSPDGARIAYISASASGSSVSGALRLVNADGSNDQSLTPNAAHRSVISAPLWSADSLRIAFTVIAPANDQSVWVYDTVMRRAVAISGADPALGSARVQGLAWLPDTASPGLTWAASDGSTVTGVFTQTHLDGSVAAERRTLAGMRFSAAAYTAQRSAGLWLVAPLDSPPTLYTLSAQSGPLSAGLAIPADLRSIVWAPNGSAAALVAADGSLSLWRAGVLTTTDVSVSVGLPAWDATSAILAAPTNAGVVSLDTRAATPRARAISATPATALIWAPDGQTLVVLAPGSITFISPSGAQRKHVDAIDADDARAAWTIAG